MGRQVEQLAQIGYAASRIVQTLETDLPRDRPRREVVTSPEFTALKETALEALPARGATIIALPMLIRGGSGGPLRAVAALP